MRFSWFWNPWEEAGTDPQAMASDVVERGRSGVGSYWMPQHPFGPETMSVLSSIGTETDGMRVGVGVVPVPPRHPLVLASQALTTASLLAGEFVLGLGMSVPRAVSGRWGLDQQKPVERFAEYLDVLMPLLAGEDVEFEGRHITARGGIAVDTDREVGLIVAAMGPRMLKLAGARGLGTFTFMATPQIVAEHTAPILRTAASGANTAPPELVVGTWVCVTDDPQMARDRAGSLFANYDGHPTGRSLLDKFGVDRAIDTALVGDEETVLQSLSEFQGTGATEIAVCPFGTKPEIARTAALVAGQQA